MIRDFSDLEVWKKAMQLVVRIYKLTKDFPKEEMYGLTSQLRRSASSICANIAEGFSRFHAKDKIKFYYNARGSISESRNHIFIAREIGYISADTAKELLEGFESIKKMLNGMIRSINYHHQNRLSP